MRSRSRRAKGSRQQGLRVGGKVCEELREAKDETKK